MPEGVRNLPNLTFSSNLNQNGILPVSSMRSAVLIKNGGLRFMRLGLYRTGTLLLHLSSLL